MKGKKFFIFYLYLCFSVFSNNIKKIESGEFHTLILRKDKKVFAFGWNESGQVINCYKLLKLRILKILL